MCIRRIISRLCPGAVPCHHIDGTRFQCRAGGPTSSASVSDLEVRPALCSITLSSLPLSAPFRPWFRTAPNDLAPSPSCVPVSRPSTSHSRWHCVCTGFGRDKNYNNLRVGSCERRGTPSLPPARVHLVARMPHSTRHPSAPFSPHTVGCNASFTSYPCICPQTRVHHTYSSRHHSPHPPFARTRTSHFAHVFPRFHPPTPSSPLIAGIYFRSRWRCGVPVFYYVRQRRTCAMGAGCTNLPPTLLFSLGRSRSLDPVRSNVSRATVVSL